MTDVWGDGRADEPQRMDADTAETVAGVIRLLRRAAELVWAAAGILVVLRTRN